MEFTTIPKAIQSDSISKRTVQSDNFKNKVDILYFFIILFCIAFLSIIFLPMIKLITVNNIKGFFNAILNESNLLSIKLSIITTMISTTLVYIFCTPLTFFFIFHQSRVIKISIDIITTIPTILPPAIAGIGLMLAFNKDSIFGMILNHFGIEFEFSTIAVILAQIFVSSGLYIQVIKSAIEKIDKEIYEVSFILGVNKSIIFLKIVLPIIRYSIINGAILAAARSLGEFGATLMFAGNIEGITRTIPLQIMTLMQSDIYSAYSLSGLILIFTILVLIIVKYVTRRDEECL